MCSISKFLSVGMALITVATGPMSEAQAERAGLVQTHAYAVLNVVHIKVRTVAFLTSC